MTIHPQLRPTITEWKEAIKYELGQQACVKCGSTSNLEIDHIVPRVDGGVNRLSNFQILCAKCHRSKSAKEAQMRSQSRQKLDAAHHSLKR